MESRALRLSLFLFTFVSTALFASHFNPYGDSVDGTQVRWEDYTAFDDARTFAASQWEALGSINFEPDAWNTVTDLEWLDVNYCDVGWDGRWRARNLSDAIDLNACYLNGYSAFSRRTVATHEAGHAIGLGDHTLSDYGSSSIVMYFCSTCSGVNTPQSHDISDHDALW